MKVRSSLVVASFGLAVMGACGDLEVDVADDIATTQLDQAVDIDVLANDTGMSEDAALSIGTMPEHGLATVLDDGRIRYVPGESFVGDDFFSYAVTDDEVEEGRASVAVAVLCEGCMVGSTITLRWIPNPPEHQVLGYRMYFNVGDDNPDDMVMIDEIVVDSDRYDAEEPEVIYDSWNALKLMNEQLACFRLTAYNAAGESGFSNSVCKPMDKSDGKGDVLFDL